MANYFPIFVLFVLAFLFVALSFVASSFLGSQRPTGAKSAPYECGIIPNQQPAERFPVKFYLVAMIFIIFDIEIVFLYPWAVQFRTLGSFGLWEMVTFALVVFVAFAYLISKGALDWGPARKFNSISNTESSTTESILTTQPHVKIVRRLDDNNAA